MLSKNYSEFAESRSEPTPEQMENDKKNLALVEQHAKWYDWPVFPANTVRKTRARIFANPVAAEALERLGALYAVDGDINGRSSEERREVRNTRRTASSCGHPHDDEHLYQGCTGTATKDEHQVGSAVPIVPAPPRNHWIALFE
jgi:hypothetical protein